MNRRHHGRQFWYRSPQMIRMIHWYRISSQLGRGCTEVSLYRVLSCLVSEVAVSPYDFYPPRLTGH
jgi:hypothetical protein